MTHQLNNCIALNLIKRKGLSEPFSKYDPFPSFPAGIEGEQHFLVMFRYKPIFLKHVLTVECLKIAINSLERLSGNQF